MSNQSPFTSLKHGLKVLVGNNAVFRERRSNEGRPMDNSFYIFICVTDASQTTCHSPAKSVSMTTSNIHGLPKKQFIKLLWRLACIITLGQRSGVTRDGLVAPLTAVFILGPGPFERWALFTPFRLAMPRGPRKSREISFSATAENRYPVESKISRNFNKSVGISRLSVSAVIFGWI